jgi:predicted phage terminase large subunit-like protein
VRKPEFDLQTLKQQVLYKLAPTKYDAYVEFVHEGRWIPAKHLLFLCSKVQDFLSDKLLTDTGIPSRILILQMPPQHGKSQTITETLPSWYLGKYPEKRVIEVSYSDDLAQVFGRRNREKLERYGQSIFGVKLSRKTRSETEFELDNGVGIMISRGILSGITGRPGDLIIIDDPIKNRQEADSEPYRNRIWDEWLNSIRTRRSAAAKTIIIMTRWHEDDLAGRLQAGEDRDTVITINLPCEAEDGDPLGRLPGQSLFPEIGKDDAWLKSEKRGYISKEGARAWNALYQGRPTSLEGNMLKREWWKYYVSLPAPMEKFDEIIQSWDMSFKDTEKSDFVVGQVWGRYKADKYLLDQVRGRMDFPATIQAVRKLSQKWPQTLCKLVEDKANGSAVIATLQQELGGFIAVNPEGGKEARVSAASPAIEAGNVFLPDPEITPWVGEFIEECAAFPTGAHDDQVDAMSQALIRLNKFIYQDPIPTELDKLAEKYGRGTPEFEIFREILDIQPQNAVDVEEII